MKTLPASATDEEILGIARSWLRALGWGDYKAAYEMTAHDPERRWTPESIHFTIRLYAAIDPLLDNRDPPRVTPDINVCGPDPRQWIERYEGDATAECAEWVWVDLPLNGMCRDIYAKFAVRRNGRTLHLVLKDISRC